MSTATDTATSGVFAEVNYVRNAPSTGDETLRFVTEDEGLSTMQTLPGQSVWIEDARLLDTDLDREGFRLVDHVSAIEDFDLIQEDPDVDQRYNDEMAALLARITGATTVFMTGGGKKRFGESAVDKIAPLTNAKPARYPHADNTDESSQELIDLIGAMVPDIDLTQYRRIALFNMWRAVTAPPQDFPLAVCDARSVEPIDEITVKAITVERATGEIIHDTTSYIYNPDHRWHYFPNMTRDQVLIFKAHDTDPARSRRVPHTAFTDPSCPPDVPTRASVESRAIALFA